MRRTQIRAAEERFRDFSGHDPGEHIRVTLPTLKTGLIVGDLDGILYTTIRDNQTEKYIHKFKKGSRPLLIASHDGKSLHIIGGKYEFTERGIIDR